MTDDDGTTAAAATGTLGYEQARDELIEVVHAAGGGRHDAGGVAGPVGAGRGAGEGLRHWLEGARARLDAALARPQEDEQG